MSFFRSPLCGHVCWLACVRHAGAGADLMLHPTRLVFDKNQRAAQIELINNGSQPATYRISLVNRRMTEGGRFEAADSATPDERFADAMLRFSPRQVTLQPGTAQTVRVMLRKPAELADGEYRSHLQFDKLPDAEGSASIENQGAAAKGIGVVLNALVGASVPVIVRHGATGASVSLTSLALQRDGAQHRCLALQFEREGNSLGVRRPERDASRRAAASRRRWPRWAASPSTRRTACARPRCRWPLPAGTPPGARHADGELPRTARGGRQAAGRRPAWSCRDAAPAARACPLTPACCVSSCAGAAGAA